MILKKMCKDCPFLKGTSMALRPGRMEGIIDHLQNDFNTFPCHKTTVHVENWDGEEVTVPHKKERICAGSVAYMLKHHDRLPVVVRIAIHQKQITIPEIEINFKLIEEPGKWPRF